MIAAAAIRTATLCRPVLKPSPTSWLAPPRWFAASSSARRRASFADFLTNLRAATLANSLGPQPTTCSAKPLAKQPPLGVIWRPAGCGGTRVPRTFIFGIRKLPFSRLVRHRAAGHVGSAFFAGAHSRNSKRQCRLLGRGLRTRPLRRRRSARPAHRREPAARRTLWQPRYLRGESQHQLYEYLFCRMQILRFQPRPARVRHLFPRAGASRTKSRR